MNPQTNSGSMYGFHTFTCVWTWPVRAGVQMVSVSSEMGMVVVHDGPHLDPWALKCYLKRLGGTRHCVREKEERRRSLRQWRSKVALRGGRPHGTHAALCAKPALPAAATTTERRWAEVVLTIPSRLCHVIMDPIWRLVLHARKFVLGTAST
jgi:hypothetical protein